MAKMFYTLEEAAAKLGKSSDEVRDMASRGQLSEFRDRDRLMFKVEQVDLLVGGDDANFKLADSGDHGSLTPAASGSAFSLADSKGGSGMGIGDAKDASAISLVDTDATEEADPSAVTRISASPMQMQDPGKSGSGTGGLLDLTKEADDTSLGAGLLDDVYGGETVAQQTTTDAQAEVGGGDAGGLFETAGTESGAEAAAAPMMVFAEQVDGLWSGIAGGLAVGMIFALGLGLFVVVSLLSGPSGGGAL